MKEAPLPPRCELGGAVEIETGLEHPGNKVSADQSQALARLRRQRAVERICAIPRLVDELLDEIGRHHGLEDDIASRLHRYAALDHGLLAAIGGNGFPPLPTRLVGGAR